jgi:glutathione S-transferase
LAGDTFTIADCYAYVMGRWAIGMKVDLSASPNFTAYFERIGARPAVKEALAAEGLS